MGSNGKMVLCPQCKIPMEYTLETEKSSNGSRRLVRYYKCYVCGSRIIDETIQIEYNGSDKILVKINDTQRVYIKKMVSPRRNRRR